MANRTISRAVRLIVLRRLRDAGVLKDETLVGLADALGVGQSTIVRDLALLDQVEEEYERLMAERPWLDGGPTAALRDAGYVPVSELAEATGYSVAHLSLLAREEKVSAEKFGGRWWIDRQSLETYVESREPGSGAPRGARPRNRGR